MTAPESIEELTQRARELAGLSLGELSARHGFEVPADFRRAKGWVGQLLERALGATAASRSVPDFESLGVELKSLPVSSSGKPRESTFVCTVELPEIADTEWEDSRVCRKLTRVLWVPVLADPKVEVAARVIGTALLWSPDAEQTANLRADWDELAGIMGRGDVDRITGHLGRYLQVRPKAAHSRVRRQTYDDSGLRTATLPRGFYLRPSFTESLLRRHFGLT